jgi:hypothetical protein
MMQDFQALNHFQDAVGFYKTRIIDNLTGVNSTDITPTPLADPPGLGPHAKEPEPPRATCVQQDSEPEPPRATCVQEKDRIQQAIKLKQAFDEDLQALKLKQAQASSSKCARATSKQAQAQAQASSSSSKLNGREVYFSNSKHNWLALANDQPDDLTHIDSEASITTSPASETKTVKPSSGLAPEVVKLPADDKADRCLLCHNRVECSTLCASCEGDVGASNKPQGCIHRTSKSSSCTLAVHPKLSGCILNTKLRGVSCVTTRSNTQLFVPFVMKILLISIQLKSTETTSFTHPLNLPLAMAYMAQFKTSMLKY